MVQTWVVVAIVAGVAVALYIYFFGGDKPLPARKPGQTGPARADAEAKPKADAGAQPKADAKTPEPAPAKRNTPAPAPAAEKPKGEGEGEKPGFRRAATVPEPAVQRKAPVEVERLHEDDDDDITIVTLTPRLDLIAAASGLPDASDPDDDDDEERAPDSDKASAVPIIYDEDAAVDEPTHAHALILVSAVGQTDLGQKRKINEDRYLVLDEEHLYVVADGMGGHAGGEVASQCAVDTIAMAFKDNKFEGELYDNVPRRGAELAVAIQMANHAIFERAKREPKLQGMGTTIVSARFTPGKQRVYIGHVGDSRCYRYRAGQLTQVTTDHTMAAIGMTGPFADHLSRAVGIAPSVKVDLLIAKPRHDDVFLLCSDGLSKMVKDDGIREVLASHEDPNEAVKVLVERANAKGGRDNITVILVVVKDPRGFAKYVQENERKRKSAEAAAISTPTPEVKEPKAKAQVEGDPEIESALLSLENASDSGIMAALKATDSGSVAAMKATDSGQVRAAGAEGTGASSSQEVKARPSVPPRPSNPPRPSVPEARKSVPDARPSVPDARKSVPGEPPKKK